MITEDQLLAKIEKVSGNNGRYMACCPAHQDSSPSLSIRSDTDDGRILLHCFAGCSVDQITESLGLCLADLFPDGTSRSMHHITGTKRQQFEALLMKERLLVMMVESSPDQERQQYLSRQATAYQRIEKLERILNEHS